MPHMFKIAIAETAWLHDVGLLTDKGSFRGLPTERYPNGPLHLEGADWLRQKQLIWKRDKGRCQLCRKPIYEDHFSEEFGLGDPDHIVKRSEGGDDSLGNLRCTHRQCHNERHPEKRVRFGPDRAQAEQEFIDICEREDRQ